VNVILATFAERIGVIPGEYLELLGKGADLLPQNTYLRVQYHSGVGSPPVKFRVMWHLRK